MSFYSVLGIIFIFAFFLIILLCLYLGRTYAIWQEQHTKGKKAGGLNLTEGAIFALLGLLVAFSFSGALDKFDYRRSLIIDEANAINTAYMRLDLLPKEKREILQTEIRNYLQLRIETYQVLPDLKLAFQKVRESLELQKSIWKNAVDACELADKAFCYMLVLPALNKAFDVASTRISNTQMHPPIFIFSLLIGVVLICGLLTGYSISKRKISSSLHIISYAFILTIVIFSIIDMEYPRLGFIQIDSFDKVLIELHQDLKP